MSGLFGQTHQRVGAVVSSCVEDVKFPHQRPDGGPVRMGERPISWAELLPQVSRIQFVVTDETEVNLTNRRRSSCRLLRGKLRLSIYQDALSFVSAK